MTQLAAFPRNLTLLISLFSVVVRGQTSQFDKRVEQLFFNVDISVRSSATIDSLKKVKGLTYIEPAGYTVYPYIGGLARHYFTFNTLPYFSNSINKGTIEVESLTDSLNKTRNIVWYVGFQKRNDAFIFFDDLIKYFRIPSSKIEVSQSSTSLRTADIEDKSAQKYMGVHITLYKTDHDFKILLTQKNAFH